MDKPQVGIAAVWYEGNTCNMHLNELAARVKEGVTGAGMVGMRFNTIGVSDGISMGTDGMSYSLQSRDLIADSIETMMAAHWYDALIALPGCDKNMPGCVMAMARLNRPAIMVYGGTIRAGAWEDRKLDIVSAFQSFGEFIAGKIDEANGGRSSSTPAREPARAAACTPPTPWLRRLKRWGCRCPTALRFRPRMRPKRTSAGGRAGGPAAARTRSQAAGHHDATGF